MSWIKRNLFFVIGAVVALALMVAAGIYTFSGWKHNADEREKLNQAYADLKHLNNLNPHPGDGRKVDNIKLAREQQKEIRDFFGKAARSFVRIPAIPSSTKVTGEGYASALRLTIDQLQREATNTSVMLPPGYNFSFEAQRQRVQFATGSLEPLAVQLGEVKAICDILNQAKINSLDSLRRERVSADDQSGPQTDYLDTHSQTNNLAVLSPYEISFRCFSPELASVVAGFANSPHGIVLKSLNVEPAGATVTDPTAVTSYTPGAVFVPAVPVAPPSVAGERDAFQRRYGLGGKDSYRPPPPIFAPQPVAPGPFAKAGLQTMLDEKQLKVTMLIQIVKLLPAKN